MTRNSVKRICADCGRVINYADGDDLCYWTYADNYKDVICEECLIKRTHKKHALPKA